MSIISAVVMFWTIWFLILLVTLPIGLQTQGEAGKIEPGTPASAPVDAMLRKKLVWTTLGTIAIWALICGIILWGGITVRDLDFFGRMG